MPLNETHDPSLKSWVESANDPATDFPIQNLPWCVYGTKERPWYQRGVPLGDYIIDLDFLRESGFFASILFGKLPHFEGLEGTWLLHGPIEIRSRIREVLGRLFRADNPKLRDDAALRARALIPTKDVFFHRADGIPAGIPNYTDFYASEHHATNVGSMFRPDNPLLPNYKHVPIGYHGRASSIVVSGTPIHRPRGQQAPPENDPKAGPTFGPSKMLDYEMELGLVIGPGNTLGSSIPIDDAPNHIFGMCIVNDWSARDVQKWEYQPLGPFLAKNFATTISPFVVTLEALEPFRVPGPRRDAEDPQPLPYLRTPGNWGLDIAVEVWLQSEQMRARALPPVMLSRGSFADLYWTIDQLVAHHTSNGCNLQNGDLLASGTISGPSPQSRGCLLELTWQGNGPDGKPLARKAIQLPTGETRTFLADGDEVIMKAYCQREGFRRIGFGECRGVILPAQP